MDLIFQTLTSLYSRSNSPAVIRSDFSHTSFLPGFQKNWGVGSGGGSGLGRSFVLLVLGLLLAVFTLPALGGLW